VSEHIGTSAEVSYGHFGTKEDTSALGKTGPCCGKVNICACLITWIMFIQSSVVISMHRISVCPSYIVLPENCAEKNGKIAQNLWENCAKNWRTCTKVVCTFHGCGVQIWPGFGQGFVVHWELSALWTATAWNKWFSSNIIYVRHFDCMAAMMPMCGLLPIYRRFVASVYVSSLVRCDLMWFSPVVLHWLRIPLSSSSL